MPFELIANRLQHPERSGERDVQVSAGPGHDAAQVVQDLHYRTCTTGRIPLFVCSGV